MEKNNYENSNENLFKNTNIAGENVEAKSVGIPASYETIRNAGKNTPEFFELESNASNAGLFRDTIEENAKSNPHGAAVTIKDIEEYKQLRLFLTQDARSGFALTQEGDVEILFSAPKMRRGDAIVASAVKVGGKSLTCYSIPATGKPKNSKGVLVNLYERAGFKEMARVDINPEYDDTKGAADYVSIMGVIDKVDNVKDFDMNGYEDAIEYRDEILATKQEEKKIKAKKRAKKKFKKIRKAGFMVMNLPIILIGTMILGFFTIIIMGFVIYESMITANNSAASVISILSSPTMRAQLQAEGLLGNKTVVYLQGVGTGTTQNSNNNKTKSNTNNNSTPTSDVEGNGNTDLNNILLSSVAGYKDNTKASAITQLLKTKSSTYSGVDNEYVQSLAKKMNVNLLLFCIDSVTEGGGTGDLINHFNGASLRAQSMDGGKSLLKADFTVFLGQPGSHLPNGQAIGGGAGFDFASTKKYMHSAGQFYYGGVAHDSTGNKAMEWNDANVHKNAPKGSFGRYGLVNTLAISYFVTANKPLVLDGKTYAVWSAPNHYKGTYNRFATTPK